MQRNLFPEPLRAALKALGDEENQVILSHLIEHGASTLEEIRSAARLDAAEAERRLHGLVLANLVERVFVGGGERWRLTGFAARLLDNIVSTILPEEGAKA